MSEIDNKDTILHFLYKNYRGETSDRSVLPMNIKFGRSKHHPNKDQWLLEAMDIDKKAVRLFAMRDIIKFY